MAEDEAKGQSDEPTENADANVRGVVDAIARSVGYQHFSGRDAELNFKLKFRKGKLVGYSHSSSEELEEE